MSDYEIPLPPPSFEFLVISFKTQIEMHLGVLDLGEGQQPPNLRLARHTIDMLAMLQEKTRGNLSYEEQRLIDNSVTEARFRYLQAVEAEKHAPAAPAGGESQS